MSPKLALHQAIDTLRELVKKLPEEEANPMLMFAEFVQQHVKPDQNAERSSLWRPRHHSEANESF